MNIFEIAEFEPDSRAEALMVILEESFNKRLFGSEDSEKRKLIRTLVSDSLMQAFNSGLLLSKAAQTDTHLNAEIWEHLEI